ncbi:trypsin-like peptidase domain-containing protein [Pseudoroseomonas cervicalis]|uniref:trypsin-like peptidase domain-containing protein n=1 Tax=Teichococcus cervicalis TaxID=204525 RepID=UPI00277F8EE1|nr:trypsin-like peptidase domain-containing protein [Pseudoroseomonas cervicalis]MDQ1081228.1 serine protease Do [Pseudoroseomonas cervicalis]
MHRPALLCAALALSAPAALPALAQNAAPAPGPGQAAPSASAPGQAAEEHRIQVVNRTGQDATALHAVRSGRADWGNNTLPRPMPTDKSFTLRSRAEAGCRFDLRLVVADGRQAVLRNRDICATPRVEIGAGDLRAAPTRPAEGTPNPRARAATGTGFVVATDRVLTNQHVVAGCNRIFIRTADGRTLPAVPPARVDEALDLALLAVPGDPGEILPFRASPELRRGEGVIAYGFPLAGLLSSDPKLTRGEVNGLNGLGNNPNHYQISAEVQPGNSGGPLLDLHGNVVGVVVSKLHAQNIARRTGDIPQNVNFAVKGGDAQTFLRRSGITPRTEPSSGTEQSAADVGEAANRGTVFIRCERP